MKLNLDFLELLVQVLQLPLIVFISVLCFRARKVLAIPDLFWIGLAFLLNFVYLCISVGSHESLYKGLTYTLTQEAPDYFNADQSLTIVRITNIIDDITFLLFLVPLYKALFKRVFIITDQSRSSRTRKFLYSVVPAVILLVLISYINLNDYFEESIVNTSIGITKALTLLYILFFFKQTRNTSVLRAYLLFIGFLIWAIVQFIPPLNLLFPWDHFNIIGFGMSFIAKCLILIGVIQIGLAVEKVKANRIIEAKIRQDEFEASSKTFEDILKNAFHEITLPLNTLENDIEQIGQFIDRRQREKHKDLITHFERIKAIITVAKNTYKPGIYEIDENETSGHSKLKTVSINTLLEKTATSIGTTFPGIDFIQLYGGKVFVKCNRTEVIQIFSNLIKNSIEAYPEETDKRIVLRSYLQKRDHNSVDRSVIVEIEDFASGIDPGNIEKVWQRDFSTKDISEATPVRGQGLHIVKALCDKNNIEIHVESPVRVNDYSGETHPGTRFTLYFKKELKD